MSSASPANDLPSPHALLFFLSHQDTYRKPLISRKEVFCGPDTATRIAAGRVFALKTPVGSFDVGEVADLLPSSQQPEIVIVKADATNRNLPRGLARFKCPRVLLVGDTHHLRNPLQNVLRYAKEEPFDFIILDHTRHHAPWFHAAGFKNVHWLPALDYGFLPRELSAAPSRPLTFVGQSGQHHPYRRHVLGRVQAAGLPLEILTGKLSQTADIYADSQITLNVSLNGDLNLRVFEALSAGGFLLTDELTAASGLPLLFKPGQHLDTWRTPDELIEKILHYQSHPEEALRIRAAGQAELIRAHHPDVKLRELHDLVFSGRENPLYVLEPAKHTVTVSGPLTTEALLPAYEIIQELHRSSARVTLFCSPDALPLASQFSDLPRFAALPVSALAGQTLDPLAPPPRGSLAEHHVLWWTGASDALASTLTEFHGTHIIAPPQTADLLAEWGFTPHESGMFLLTDTMAWLRQTWHAGAKNQVHARLAVFLAHINCSDDALFVAEIAGRLDNMAVYKDALHRAIFLDRNCVPALYQLASLMIESGEPASAALILEEAARVAPLPSEIEPLHAQLLAEVATYPEVDSYLSLTHRKPVQTAETPRRILLVTNLFPPEELGGYGRMMWEFAHGLRERGHTVRILCGQAAYLRKTPTADEAEMETHVSRSLQLLGEWRDGPPRLVGDEKKLANLAASNARRVLEGAAKFRPDFILAGNIDFLGLDFLSDVLTAGYPVLHALANAAPGYAPADQPVSDAYLVAPCSDWNGRAYHQAGYANSRMTTLYPGARLDRFYRMFLPDARRLRIAYASLVMPYKGVHVLIQALARLHVSGVDFTAEIAGDSTDQAFLAEQKAYVVKMGMQHRVKFTGFLDRDGLFSLFARSNVLVFPSQFAEPFGISQVEALASGLVVVSSGTGGAAEIIRDGQDGLLFPAADFEALAARLVQLSNNPQLFRELQRNGQKRALDFSVDGAVFKIEKLAGELLAQAPAQIAV